MKKDSGLIHEKLSEQIIGAAMAVLNELGPGLDEKLYENALIIELTSRGLTVNQQKQFSVLLTIKLFEWCEDFYYGDTEKNAIIGGCLFRRKDAKVQRTAKK